jgi:type I restriction enzyme, R subunit
MGDHFMNEADTRAELIEPALIQAGWGKVPGSRVKREVITLGRIVGKGVRGKQEIADFVLYYKGHKLAVIEAKKKSAHLTEGLSQAKRYAEKLEARFAYSTNGVGIYQVDMKTGVEKEVSAYPAPEELWKLTFSEDNFWRERFSEVPFEDKGGSWEGRFYQHNAIMNALEAISEGRSRILLTLATGTGKTFIAFQLAWKLFHSRWNLKAWKEDLHEHDSDTRRRPRILFLADRNNLAGQAYNAFSAFPEDALVRISPAEIRKKGMVPKNGSIFFTIFQTFMSGKDESGATAPYFGDYPEDFFDFIIIDECHRGGANDESSWRGILEYFSPAVQLGLTATPKRRGNIDTYAYFGEPLYTYSLKEGINDGYLTPFKVKQIATTLDEYVYTSDDLLLEGEIEEGRRYQEPDFNRIIEIKEREQYRVKVFMDMIDQRQKTIVFCATQDHALAVRDLINQMKTNSNPNYCVRVTANDGEQGNQFLKEFQDNERTIPTILTTSQKLSTGVDARNVRNIVLMRPVNSMIEFKQIIGRGTRLYDGKDYFTIYDFVKAYEHFNDPEWDGEPVELEEPTPRSVPATPAGYPEPEPDPGGIEESPAPSIVKIKLADGKERSIQHMSATSFWSPDGTPISSAQFIEALYGELPELFKDEDELRTLWSNPETRKKLLEGLEEKGFSREQLQDTANLINAQESDLYDVLAYIAFALPTITRKERVETRQDTILKPYTDSQKDFLTFVLSHYIDQGVEELDQDKLPDLLELKYQSVNDAVSKLGAVSVIRDVFVGFQRYLYG